MAEIEITTNMLINEVDDLNAAIADWITLASEKLGEESHLNMLGYLVMQHMDVFTTCLLTYFANEKNHATLN